MPTIRACPTANLVDHSMSIKTVELNCLSAPHICNERLEQLNDSLLEITDLLIYQVEQSLHALDYCEIDLALKVIARDKKINHHLIKIDTLVMSLLDDRSLIEIIPSTAISTNKIAMELENIGNEIVEFAERIIILFDSNFIDPARNSLTDIFKLGELVKVMLDKVMDALEIKDSSQAYSLLNYGMYFETELQTIIMHQLRIMQQDINSIEPMVTVMQILDVFKRNAEHCKNIAEYLVFMLDGVDIRHGSISPLSI